MLSGSRSRAALAVVSILSIAAFIAASSTELVGQSGAEAPVASVVPTTVIGESPNEDDTEPPDGPGNPPVRSTQCVEPLVPAPLAFQLPDPQPVDELHIRVLAELDDYLQWLDNGDARGIITEVGWPNGEWTAEWNAVAETWYRALRDVDIWVTVWAAGAWWEPTHDLSVYRSSNGIDLDTTTGISPMVERHRAVSRRGINLNGAEFGIGGNIGTGTGGWFSNRSPGTYGNEWKYPSDATYAFLQCRGIDMVRLPFRWERVQPEPGGELDRDELDRLSDAIARAGRAGIDVIPVPMNYGAYWLHDAARGVGERRAIGSPEISAAHFADLWARLASALAGHDNILAWDLMNEPTLLPDGEREWETASQAALDAIRSTGDTRTVVVAGYSWATLNKFSYLHPDGPWLVDPLDNVRYAGHHYFDDRLTGRFLPYDIELGGARVRLERAQAEG